MTEKTNAELVDEVEVIACMIEDRVFRALDMNDGNTLRVFAARLAAAEAENVRMREACQLAKKFCEIGNVIGASHEGENGEPCLSDLLDAALSAAGSAK